MGGSCASPISFLSPAVGIFSTVTNQNQSHRNFLATFCFLGAGMHHSVILVRLFARLSRKAEVFRAVGWFRGEWRNEKTFDKLPHIFPLLLSRVDFFSFVRSFLAGLYRCGYQVRLVARSISCDGKSRLESKKKPETRICSVVEKSELINNPKIINV